MGLPQSQENGTRTAGLAARRRLCSWRVWLSAVVLGGALALGFAAARLAPAWASTLALSRLERQGDTWFQQGDAHQAQRLWQTVLDKHPGAVGARNKLAVLAMREGRYAEAEQCLAAGIERAPKTVSFHFNLGLVKYMQGERQDALAALAEVERLYPDHGKVHLLKGVIFDELGEHDRARDEFVKELNLDPATPAAWTRLEVGPTASVQLCDWKIPGVCR